MRLEAITFRPVWDGLQNNLTNFNGLVIITLALTISIFFIQNVLLHKYYDHTTIYRKRKLPPHPKSHLHSDSDLRSYDTRFHSNELYLYPYTACLLALYALFIFRSNLNSSAAYTFSYRFELFRGITVSPKFALDNINIGFLLTTLTIGLGANMVWHYYMLWEANQRRFQNLLNGFLFSMALLLLSSNLLTLLLFWEFIGLFSYFLINFWNKKPATFKSATKAMVYNQLSDIFLVLGIVIYYNLYGTLTIPHHGDCQIPPAAGSEGLYKVMCVSFLLAASCKSAQVPLHVWLPDSMDAPAPASALIHSATLVAAGIFLILKVWPILRWDIGSTKVFTAVALVTIVVGGIAATMHSDMKKILAYSTVSNCGFMMFFALNTTADHTVYFFMAHGYLKAGSFIALSVMMSGLLHKQDYRNIGGIGSGKPFWTTNAAISIGMLGALPLSIMQPLKHELVAYSTPVSIYSELVTLSINIGVITSMLYSTKLIANILYFPHRKPHWFTYNLKWLLGLNAGATRSAMYFGAHGILFLFLLYHIKYVLGFMDTLTGFPHQLHAFPSIPVTLKTCTGAYMSNKLQTMGTLLIALPIWSQRSGSYATKTSLTLVLLLCIPIIL